MLSYKHGFHAGNHADVLKHTTLLILLDKLKQKEKPFTYIDTHSGAGLYDLNSEEANKTQEYQQGILNLNAQDISQFPALQSYQSSVMAEQANHLYLGSPKIAQQALRAQDKIVLVEMHNNEVSQLKRNMRGDDRVSIHHNDGFERLPAIAPPNPIRGIALIDPAYEVKDDYKQVVQSVKKSLKKWPVGIFAIWYPILAADRDRSEWLTQQLSELEANNILNVQLCVSEQATDFGMHGSGMLIVNAPYQTDTQIQDFLPHLTQILAQDKAAFCKVEWLIEPK